MTSITLVLTGAWGLWMGFPWLYTQFCIHLELERPPKEYDVVWWGSSCPSLIQLNSFNMNLILYIFCVYIYIYYVFIYYAYIYIYYKYYIYNIVYIYIIIYTLNLICIYIYTNVYTSTKSCPFPWGMEDVWPDGHVDLTLRTRDPQTRLERLQQRVLRQVASPRVQR